MKIVLDLEIEEVLDRKVIKFGNSGRINIPVKHLGKDVKVIILPKSELNTAIPTKGASVDVRNL
jgi:putative transposon-encoded protein